MNLTRHHAAPQGEHSILPLFSEFNMNKKQFSRGLPLIGAIGFAASALLACGGGGGSSSTTPVPTTAASFTAIDGLIKGAIVCIDANQNGLCDAGETQGTTDTSGAVTLNIPTADVGKYPILAVVPAGAVDADDPANPITTGYTLKAPADNASVITPLTTLVQHQVENGLTSAQAAIAVQDQTGVTNAFANFIATPDVNARVVAKTIVQITQAKLADSTLTAIVGTNDPLTGKPITQADLNAAIRAAIMQTLPSIVAAVNTQSQTGGACVDPTAATCKAAIAAAVTGTSGLAASTGITAANLGTLVGIAKSTSTQTEAAPIANATLKWLKYTDASNWYYRVMASSLAENTFDANNLRRYRDIRATDTAGVVATAGGLVNQGRTDDLHWNGSAWVAACTNAWQNTQTTRDANGVATFDYCDGYLKGKSTLVKVDYAAKTIADMVSAVRSYPSQGDGLAGVGFAGWGASDNKATTALAAGFSSTAALPTGAALYYVTTTPTEYALSYIVSGPAAQLTQTSAATAAGGDATSGGTPTCSLGANQAFTTATSLNASIAQNQGTPCKFGVSTVTGAGAVVLSSGSQNEWWDQSTLDIGTIGTASTSAASAATSFYTTNTKIRVAFPAGASQVANFYACQQRYDGSSRNCTSIGAGAYTITPLGDAKVLAFTGVPAQAAPLTYARAFVERAGVVRYGFVPKLIQSSDVRPNLAATNALFNVLGIPAITP
jgi:trimeric autotransporter adhesin